MTLTPTPTPTPTPTANPNPNCKQVGGEAVLLDLASEIVIRLDLASEVTSEMTSEIVLRSFGSGSGGLADALVEAICPLPSPG